MIICKYNRKVSKDDKPFEDVGTDEFRTPNELEAYRVIQRWNNRGGFASEVNVKWRYDFISIRLATGEDMDNEKMQYFKSDNC